MELPDKSKIKLIATDLDGTLLGSKGKLTEKTKTVINKVLLKYPDLHFVIATGRTQLATAKIRYDLGIKGRPYTESLNVNGCVAYDSQGHRLWRNVLPTEYIIKFHNLLKNYPDAVYRYTFDNTILTFSKKWAEKTRKLMQENVLVEDREEHIRTILSGGESDINRVSFVYKGSNWKEILEQLETLRIEYNLESTHPASNIIDYMPSQTNKGSSLIRLLEKLNISKNEVIAFGDGGNDIELLQNVGWPIAVENACEDLKSYAKIITKSNREDGVAYILEQIFL
ncbi:hypothetical protein BCR36DRAFT_579471 [Piromyces finnis]|uniref:HAD-like protein n=1 Tax=Piromyces finnis TaxID=1754191 RepID=A0A1Y1VM72_9FUNG|nr:hypothetical protein BCR36DRAFT_579471 [Piromyces finnis]|eukprot:ORX60025.1 hypothetical protein BCR36DRAFT_579471 [Piromyces finnis]